MAAYTTIDNPELYFQVKLWTGTGSGHAITLDGDEDMSPNFIWVKQRTSTRYHNIQDTIRSTGVNFFSNTNGADNSDATNITAFNTDGFSVGTGDNVNKSSDTYVAWCWKESADAGFDMLTYTGNETNRTISHSLSAVPHLMIVKNREAAEAWTLYHHKNTSAPETECLYMNLTDATRDSNLRWNDTLPTSSVFSVSTSTEVNDDGVGMMNYLWSEKQGFSKFGSFVGNGSTSGPMIWLGFRPAFVMIKRSSSTGNWYIADNKRNTFNVVSKALFANADSAEGDLASNTPLDFTSNGFKLRNSDLTGDTNINISGSTYIYLAFAEAPFVNSKGVPCNAR